jgi:predicted  nucleic acid-binding Zn-ribbon protein
MNEIEITKRITDELITDAETGKAILEASAQQMDEYLQHLTSELNRVGTARVKMEGKIEQSQESIEQLKAKRAKLDEPLPAPVDEPKVSDAAVTHKDVVASLEPEVLDVYPYPATATEMPAREPKRPREKVFS